MYKSCKTIKPPEMVKSGNKGRYYFLWLCCCKHSSGISLKIISCFLLLLFPSQPLPPLLFYFLLPLNLSLPSFPLLLIPFFQTRDHLSLHISISLQSGFIHLTVEVSEEEHSKATSSSISPFSLNQQLHRPFQIRVAPDSGWAGWKIIPNLPQNIHSNTLKQKTKPFGAAQLAVCLLVYS